MTFTPADLYELEEPYISPFHRWSVGVDIMAAATAIPASAAWTTNGRAVFVPLYLPRAVVLRRFFRLNGATITGAVTADLGIYRADAGTAPTKVISTGETTLTGTNVCQYFDVTDTDLEPGFYYMALTGVGTAGNCTIFRIAPAINITKAWGLCTQTVTPLPATATLAAAAASFIPVFGFTTRATP